MRTRGLTGTGKRGDKEGKLYVPCLVIGISMFAEGETERTGGCCKHVRVPKHSCRLTQLVREPSTVRFLPLPATPPISLISI